MRLAKISRLGWALLTLLAIGLACACFHFATTLVINLESMRSLVTTRPDTRPDAIKYEEAWTGLGAGASLFGFIVCCWCALAAVPGTFGIWEDEP